MSQEIRIPDIGDAEDVEVVEILVSNGDQVGKDDPIIVIESDKASMEVPAGATGTIDSVTVSVGDKVSEGQVIARLKEGAGAEEAGGKPEQAEEPSAEVPDEEQTDEATEPEAAKEGARDGEQAPKPAKATRKPPSGERAAKPGKREVVVQVPDVGEAENVEVIEVAIKPGDHVDADDLLVVVESDKASMEIPSSHAGTVKEVHVAVGAHVEEGTRLVTLEAEGAAEEAGAPPAPAEKTAARGEPEPEPEQRATSEEETREQPKAEPAAEAPARPEPAEAEAAGDGAGVYAGPAVRRLARELGVELSAVRGTGSRGRIVKDDVKSFVKERMAGGGVAAGAAPAAGGIPPLPAVDFGKFGEIEEQPLSRTRASGAQNLHRSWLNLPHVTQHDEVDVTDLEDFRASLKGEAERRDVKLTPLAFIIKACCHALKEFPTFNASLDPGAKKFILKRYYHIGMAVDTPEGLVVPVIRDADRKGVWQLSAEIVELAEKARNKKLGMDDMRGGSFSVSSLGPIGGTGFTPIINAPEVAILGVSRVTVRPVWRGESFVPRKMLPLSLSYDHRAINGAEAGRFVVRLGEVLSDIRRLAL